MSGIVGFDTAGIIVVFRIVAVHIVAVAVTLAVGALVIAVPAVVPFGIAFWATSSGVATGRGAAIRSLPGAGSVVLHLAAARCVVTMGGAVGTRAILGMVVRTARVISIAGASR